MITKSYKMENSRSFKRLKADYLIKYQVAGSGQEPFIANIKDISGGGLKFWSDHYLPEGTLLRVSVWVPPIERTIEGLARIARVRQARGGVVYYMAARFLEIASEDQKALDGFIEKLAKDPEAKDLIENEPVVKRTVFRQKA
jgi:c-di-GMP-binding flagellar brake protein YcgR